MAYLRGGLDLNSSINSFWHTRNYAALLLLPAEGGAVLIQAFYHHACQPKTLLVESHTGEMAKKPENNKFMSQLPFTHSLNSQRIVSFLFLKEPRLNYSGAKLIR